MNQIPFMTAATTDRFNDAYKALLDGLLDTDPIHPAQWQSRDVSDSPAHATHELQQVTFYYDMPQTQEQAVDSIHPDLPWAEGHFGERVGQLPINPGYWHAKWPYHAGQVDLHQNEGIYDHNYMERFWARKLRGPEGHLWEGYRFSIGDLGSVVSMLRRDPTTRQAYLPVWFPEDTGATQGQRVPCTLGYHFLIRDGVLNVSYYLRSCEIRRHFVNDVYMACRLAQWVARRVPGRVSLGILHMSIASLHGFVGDRVWMEEKSESFT